MRLSMGGTRLRLYPRPESFGIGQRFRMFRPSPYRRLAGIFPTVPPSAKQPVCTVVLQGRPVVESRIRLKSALLLSSDCEKSPVRSSAVGTRNRLGLPPPLVRGEN